MPVYLIDEHDANDSMGALCGVAEVQDVRSNRDTSKKRFIENPYRS